MHLRVKLRCHIFWDPDIFNWCETGWCRQKTETQQGAWFSCTGDSHCSIPTGTSSSRYRNCDTVWKNDSTSAPIRFRISSANIDQAKPLCRLFADHHNRCTPADRTHCTVAGTLLSSLSIGSCALLCICGQWNLPYNLKTPGSGRPVASYNAIQLAMLRIRSV